MTKPRYERGQRIDTLMDMLAFLLADAVFYIPGGNKGFRDVPAAFLRNWSITQLQRSIKYRLIYLAEKRGAL